MRIVKNPDNTKYKDITKAVNDNEGYCPCMIDKNIDTKCPCKPFREQTTVGECHCGRYVKVSE